MRVKLLKLPQQALPSASVCIEYLIHKGCGISEGGICQGIDILETRGDVIIRGLWDRQNNSIIDIKLGDADVDTYMIELM